eukprot:3576721-Amphidinium_carterae.2
MAVREQWATVRVPVPEILATSKWLSEKLQHNGSDTSRRCPRNLGKRENDTLADFCVSRTSEDFIGS